MYSRQMWQVSSASFEGVHELACGTERVVGICTKAGFADIDGKVSHKFRKLLSLQEERTVARFRV